MVAHAHLDDRMKEIPIEPNIFNPYFAPFPDAISAARRPIVERVEACRPRRIMRRHADPVKLFFRPASANLERQYYWGTDPDAFVTAVCHEDIALLMCRLFALEYMMAGQKLLNDAALREGHPTRQDIIDANRKTTKATFYGDSDSVYNHVCHSVADALLVPH